MFRNVRLAVSGALGRRHGSSCYIAIGGGGGDLISVLHTADWQIGRVFAQFEPDNAAALFEARFAVVE